MIVQNRFRINLCFRHSPQNESFAKPAGGGDWLTMKDTKSAKKLQNEWVDAIFEFAHIIPPSC